MGIETKICPNCGKEVLKALFTEHYLSDECHKLKLRAKVKQLQAEIGQLQAENKTIKMERNILAMLSADDPQFFYPHGAIEAKTLRDRILLGKPLES